MSSATEPQGVYQMNHVVYPVPEELYNTLSPREKKIYEAWKRHLTGEDFRPGGLLENGAMLLAERVLTSYVGERISIVLAFKRGYQPFVVWSRVVRTTERIDTTKHLVKPDYVDYCVSGGYHRELEDAIREFNERCGRVSGTRPKAE